MASTTRPAPRSDHSSSVRLRWSGEGLRFVGGAEGGPAISLESGGESAPSPTQLLLLSLAGCMGVDVLDILNKCRVPVEDIVVEISGERAETPPRYFRSIDLVYRIKGPVDGDQAKLDRAVQLSRDKYCSVLHTLRKDLELDIRIEPS